MAAGPCYRCIFPEAPRPESCSRCSDAGVLGVVPGIIGTLQVCHNLACMMTQWDLPLTSVLLWSVAISSRQAMG